MVQFLKSYIKITEKVVVQFLKIFIKITEEVVVQFLKIYIKITEKVDTVPLNDACPALKIYSTVYENN